MYRPVKSLLSDPKPSDPEPFVLDDDGTLHVTTPSGVTRTTRPPACDHRHPPLRGRTHLPRTLLPRPADLPRPRVGSSPCRRVAMSTNRHGDQPATPSPERSRCGTPRRHPCGVPGVPVRQTYEEWPGAAAAAKVTNRRTSGLLRRGR